MKKMIAKGDGVWLVLIGTALFVSLAWVFLSYEGAPITEPEEQQPVKMEKVKPMTKSSATPAVKESGGVVLHLKGRFQ
ncbi:MAG: hypothetical protein WCL61_03380 [bacterium]